MGARLIIDLAKCDLQENSNVRCSCNNHPENKGIDSLLEMIRFSLICRRCESARLVSKLVRMMPLKNCRVSITIRVFFSGTTCDAPAAERAR